MRRRRFLASAAAGALAAGLPGGLAAARAAGMEVRQVILEPKGDDFPSLPGDFEALRRDGYRCGHFASMARILRGEHPRDIPFERPAKYQMRLNLKTASRIGVKVPHDVLLMMDEVLR